LIHALAIDFAGLSSADADQEHRVPLQVLSVNRRQQR
jgi:hypothetical protein